MQGIKKRLTNCFNYWSNTTTITKFDTKIAQCTKLSISPWISINFDDEASTKKKCFTPATTWTIFTYIFLQNLPVRIIGKTTYLITLLDFFYEWSGEWFKSKYISKYQFQHRYCLPPSTTYWPHITILKVFPKLLEVQCASTFFTCHQQFDKTMNWTKWINKLIATFYVLNFPRFIFWVIWKV